MLEKTFPVTGPVELACGFGAGALAVRAVEGADRATVRVVADDPDLPLDQLFRVELTGNRLEVQENRDEAGSLLRSILRGVSSDRRRVRVSIELPAGSAARIAVGSATIAGEGRLGDCEVSNGSGGVTFEMVDGTLRTRGGSGELAVSRLTGAGQIRGGSGQVRLGEAGGALSISVGSGNVRVGTAHGNVRVRSGSAAVTVEVAEGDVDVACSSGPVTVGIRPGWNAKLDVATGSGRLRTEMPMTDSAPATGGERITIRARTGSGNITVQRAVPVGA